MIRGRGRGSGWRGKAAFIVLGVALAALFGWLAVRGADWTAVGDAMSGFPLPLVPLVLGLSLLSNFVRAARWRLLWTEHSVSIWRLFYLENAALGLNNVSPVRALEEAFLFGVLTLRDRLPGSSVVATIMMARIQDLVFTIVFIGISIPMVAPILSLGVVLIGPAVYFVIWLVVLLNFGRIVERVPRLRRIKALHTFQAALARLMRRKRRMAASFGLTVSYWALLGPVAWLISEGVGADVRLGEATVTVFVAIFFSTAVPGIPGGLGTFEFAVVALMGLWGVPREPAIAFAVVLRVVLFVPPILFAGVVIPREGIGSVRELRRLLSAWREPAG